MKTVMKTKNMNNIHVFRVNRVSAKVKETSNQAAVDKANSRTRLTAETKRSICEDHMENPKITQEVLALKYGCKRTTVAKIIKSKDRWLSIDSDNVIAKRFRQRNSRYPLVENALLLWLQEEHSDSSSVTDQMLRSQARHYAKEFDKDGIEEFKASSSWVSNFKQRYMMPKVDITPPNNYTITQSDTPNKPSVNRKTPELSISESPDFEVTSCLENPTTTSSFNITENAVESTVDQNSDNSTESCEDQNSIEADGNTQNVSSVSSKSSIANGDDTSNEQITPDRRKSNSPNELNEGIKTTDSNSNNMIVDIADHDIIEESIAHNNTIVVGNIMAEDMIKDITKDNPMTNGIADDVLKEDTMKNDPITGDGITDDGIMDDGIMADGIINDGIMDDGIRDDNVIMVKDGIADNRKTDDVIMNDVIMNDRVMRDKTMIDGIMHKEILDTHLSDETVDEQYDHGDQDYGGDQDYCDTDQPCFVDNSNFQVANPVTLNTYEKPITKDIKKRLLDKSVTEPIGPKHNVKLDTASQKNTKQMAKQHLEAALAFYTAQKEGSSQSMSADMIKLILQNDF